MAQKKTETVTCCVGRKIVYRYKAESEEILHKILFVFQLFARLEQRKSFAKLLLRHVKHKDLNLCRNKRKRCDGWRHAQLFPNIFFLSFSPRLFSLRLKDFDPAIANWNPHSSVNFPSIVDDERQSKSYLRCDTFPYDADDDLLQALLWTKEVIILRGETVSFCNPKREII